MRALITERFHRRRCRLQGRQACSRLFGTSPPVASGSAPSRQTRLPFSPLGAHGSARAASPARHRRFNRDRHSRSGRGARSFARADSALADSVARGIGRTFRPRRNLEPRAGNADRSPSRQSARDLSRCRHSAITAVQRPRRQCRRRPPLPAPEAPHAVSACWRRALHWLDYGLPPDLTPPAPVKDDIHGGWIETAVMLHLAPTLVERERGRAADRDTCPAPSLFPSGPVNLGLDDVRPYRQRLYRPTPILADCRHGRAPWLMDHAAQNGPGDACRIWPRLPETQAFS